MYTENAVLENNHQTWRQTYWQWLFKNNPATFLVEISNVAKTDIHSELPLTSFDVTHAGLAAVKFKVYIYVLTIDFTPQHQRKTDRQTDRQRELKAFD